MTTIPGKRFSTSRSCVPRSRHNSYPKSWVLIDGFQFRWSHGAWSPACKLFSADELLSLYAEAFSAFLAYGILRLGGHNGLEGWRWLFALEGLVTGLIGIISYFYLPPSPTQTASKFRGNNGSFSEHEEKIIVNRILRDDPSKGLLPCRTSTCLTNIAQVVCTTVKVSAGACLASA
jgi:hypothetical protein